ncbi:uncharacterized protein XB22061511.L [Xenopus laevis]|uniref:Uncharacterized protein XB22061511.L n=2 Tax=Xenopus laevis TaxID=8355 RepID=A0A1L8H329_XENLA|nr:uncharacterized protein XB22061511.L [Xenopus laevis]OCT90517.1 hypothetical protein XELAEV_18019133mg [Xenopus laevis]
MTTLSLPVNSSDLESQDSLRRCRCLDHCLVISVVLIILTLGSFGVYYIGWERPSPIAQNLIANNRNVKSSRAHLVPNSTALKNRIWTWFPNGVDTVHVDEDFAISSDSTELVIHRTGLYYIYSQISVICRVTNGCKKDGLISLNVLRNGDESSPILTVNMTLENAHKTKFYGTTQLLFKGESLSTKLWTDNTDISWELNDKNDNYLGLFMVTDTKDIQISSEH